MAVVGRPPVLRRSHHLFNVLLQGVDVQVFERFGVVEISTRRVRNGGVLAEGLQIQLVRPPVLIRGQFVSPFEGMFVRLLVPGRKGAAFH